MGEITSKTHNLFKILKKTFFDTADDTRPTQKRFTVTPGPTSLPVFHSRPMECFTLFFTSAIWNFLVVKKNEFAHHKLEKYSMGCSLKLNLKLVTITEMKAFVSVILNMAIIQLQI